MASNFNSAPGTRPASPALDSGIAALAAVATGFATYAMPADMFARLVEGSGLPLLLTAAQPPLGLTARIVAIAAGGFAAFGLVWLLMRALDRVPQRRDVEIAEEEIDLAEAPLPRLRRFDAHPDAPARRPIFAGREFGEPIDSGIEETVLDDVLPVPAEEPLELEADSIVQPEAEPDSEPVADYAVAEPSPLPSVVEHVEPGDDSISSLMQRLEGGLERGGKKQALSGAVPAVRDGQSGVAGHRLRGAIRDLQKMAGQG